MNEENKIIVSEDYQKAVTLDRKIKTNAQMAQESLFEVCKGLKEMRDGKLYKELGYQRFEDYSEQEIGIKHSQAYKYISIAEKLPEDFFHSSGKIGIQKLYLLSAVSEAERLEITENTDLEKTSVKNLENEIKALKDRNKILEDENRKNSNLKNEVINLEEHIENLENQIEQLENRPVEVAVSDNGEVEKMRKAMAKNDLEWRTEFDKLQEENQKEILRHNQEVEEIRAEYEKKLAEIPKAETTDNKEIFKAYLSNAIDSSKRLLEFINKNPDEFFKDKIKEFFKKIVEEL